MRSFSVFILSTLIISGYVVADPFQPSHAVVDTESSSESARAEAPQIEEPFDRAKYSKGKWNAEFFYYLGTDGRYYRTQTAKIANKDGSITNPDGSVIDYKAGDVLFKIKSYGWAKASPEIPRVPALNLLFVEEGVELTETQKYVAQYINEARQKRGLKPLTVSKSLQANTQLKAVNMARSTNMSHGVAPTSGYSAENIAAGQRTAREVVNSWINSPGHYTNLMGAGYRKTGVGLGHTSAGYRLYWAQQFR